MVSQILKSDEEIDGNKGDSCFIFNLYFSTFVNRASDTARTGGPWQSVLSVTVFYK